MKKAGNRKTVRRKRTSPAKKAGSRRNTGSRQSATSSRNNTEKVNEFMNSLEHPFKKEVQAVRDIIINVDEKITEEIKWAAPSFSYKGYMATFNLWAKKQVHLVFHNGAILKDRSGLLEGDYVDRRMVYFSSMEDVNAKRPALENAVRKWVKVMDK